MAVVGSQTTTPFQSDYLDQVFSEARRLYESGQLAPTPFMGQRITPMSEQRRDALQMQEDIARAGNPFTAAQTGGLVSTLRGDLPIPRKPPGLTISFLTPITRGSLAR